MKTFQEWLEAYEPKCNKCGKPASQRQDGRPRSLRGGTCNPCREQGQKGITKASAKSQGRRVVRGTISLGG